MSVCVCMCVGMCNKQLTHDNKEANDSDMCISSVIKGLPEDYRKGSDDRRYAKCIY